MQKNILFDIQECLIMIEDLDGMIENLVSARASWHIKLMDLVKTQLPVTNDLQDVKVDNYITSIKIKI